MAARKLASRQNAMVAVSVTLVQVHVLAVKSLVVVTAYIWRKSTVKKGAARKKRRGSALLTTPIRPR